MSTKKATTTGKRKAGDGPASSSSSSSSSSSGESAEKKTRISRSILPDGVGWMKPFFCAMGGSTDLQGRAQRHVILSVDLRAALKQYILHKDKQLIKMAKDLGNVNGRFNSQYRGLQKNGNAWAVLASKENAGNSGRKYVGTYDDEGQAALRWDQEMIKLNGTAAAWKLNFPQNEETLALVQDRLVADIGKVLSWGGKGVQGQYRCTKYYGVFEVLAEADCLPFEGGHVEKGSSSSSSTTPKKKKIDKLGPSKPLPSEDQAWIPGLAAPYVALARIGGRATVLGKYSSAEEAAQAYDEFAEIVELPMNKIAYELVRQARENQSIASQTELARLVKERGLKLSKRGRKPNPESTTKGMKKVSAEELKELKAAARGSKANEKKIVKLQAKNEKMKEALDKKKGKGAPKPTP